MSAKPTRQRKDPGLLAALKAAGGVSKLADLLGLGRAAVSRWDRVPVPHILAIEARLGVSRYDQRPDIHPRLRAKK
jgi:DNA-binding transcriptional regulator YdaS (Cro superfamily)